MLGKAVKVTAQIAVGLAMGVMVHDFSKKYVGEPLQKFMDNVAEEKYKKDKEKIEKGL